MLRERLLPGQRSDANLPPAESAGTKRSFEDVLDLPDDLLRGISLSTLLAGGARLFARHGAAAREDPNGTYALSRQCHTLDFFCSHSWSTSRWLKYVALLVHFNLGAALIAMLLSNCVCVFLSLWCPHLLPSWLWAAYPIQPDNSLGRAPLTAELVCGPVFLTVLCVAHRFRSSRSLFLDIACIRQDSDSAKADGIAALGAVLDRSQRMLVLCDAHYFSRLWCTFELAAYTKREGAARIDLLPLHEPLVTLSLLLYLLSFFVLGIVLEALIMTYAPHMMEDYRFFPLLTLMLHTPPQLFVVAAQVEACRMRSAVADLSRFRLEDARCHSDADREELLKLIAKWFSDRTRTDGASGEDARRLGFHRFETYVRHAVAPSLISSHANRAKLLVAAGVFTTAPMFDMMCSEACTPNHLLSLLSTITLLVTLTIPCYLLVYRQSARLVIALRERWNWSAVPAYAVGVLLNLVALISFFVAFALSGPTQIFAPDYRLPQGAGETGSAQLDATGRKLIATNYATTFTGFSILAVAGLFKF